MGSLLSDVLEAHGGAARWRRLRAIRVRLRFGGLAFALRWNQAGRREREVVVRTDAPGVVFHDFPRPGWTGHFTADRVWVTAPDGGPRSARRDPRAAFAGIRRAFWWDDLDLLYFAGYAAWNYFTAPFLLALPGVTCREVEPWSDGSDRWRRLAVRFPPDVPTHSPELTFYVDSCLRIRRHDYTAGVFASWASAAHFSDWFDVFDGIPVATRRRVVPRRADGSARRGPTLVWIRVSAWTAVAAEPPAAG